MRAVEGADAEMHDPGRDRRGIIGRAAHAGHEPRERLTREPRKRRHHFEIPIEGGAPSAFLCRGIELCACCEAAARTGANWEAPRRSSAAHFVFEAPISWSQRLKASTILSLSSGVSIGAPAIHLLILRPPEFLDRRLARRRRHGEGHVLHGRARIEIALVIGEGLLVGREAPI